MSTVLSSPLKWHGGKHFLAERIVRLFPPRCQKPNSPAPDDLGYLHYVEPYAGGLSVLLANDPEGISEVVNDKHKGLTNFWHTLCNPELFTQFQRRVEAMPFAQQLWEEAAAEMAADGSHEWPTPAGWEAVSRAVAFFVHCRQSLAGRMDAFAPLSRNRTRRGMNEQASAWLNCVEGLPAVHARLKRVVVLNRDALDVIQEQDGPRSLFYLDPPYLHETRVSTGEYDHEMTEEQHGDLLEVLAAIKGRFLLSGYRSVLYDQWASAYKWNRHDFDLPNNSAGGKEKRRMVECVWTNY